MIFEIIMGLYLLILAIIDMLNKSIPVYLLLAGAIPVGFSLLPGNSETDLVQRAAGLALGLVILIAAKATKEKIGYGDGMVLVILGITLGIAQVCELLALSLFLLITYSLAMIARGRFGKNSRIAFLPFLFAGYILIMVA